MKIDEIEAYVRQLYRDGRRVVLSDKQVRDLRIIFEVQ